MENGHGERLAHVGGLAAVSNDLGFLDMLKARLGPDPHEGRTPGEAVAGMRRNGLGFATRPLSLTPQCLASPPRDLGFHDGIRAELCNRCKLGRTLAEAAADGGALRVQERARCVGARDGIDRRFHQLDPSSFARSGEDLAERDEQAIAITPG